MVLTDMPGTLNSAILESRLHSSFHERKNLRPKVALKILLSFLGFGQNFLTLGLPILFSLKTLKAHELILPTLPP